ncbi:uncharacterized protein LOC122028009 [Zingiber officinale]|uniref:Uncharacterized protein n=1 Tax=Zingiber officinale TaxID=94328 RepID=A0A8J5CCT1_ZINOF|nr:uncharacterized protein LOC122028009 [Zingiber officinale]KAG6473156.1 hypothetical protein ZIOFF_067063 [Zingiber officinale]
MARRGALYSQHPPSAMPPATSARRPPVILKRSPPVRARCAEVAGGTAADCVAVCCCFPCAAVDVVVLTAVRLPAGICRKVMRARKARMRKLRDARLLGKKTDDETSPADSEEESECEEVAAAAGLTPVEMAEVEMEMSARFHGAGFWRSPSQKEEPRSRLIY